MRVSHQVILASTNYHKWMEFQKLLRAVPEIQLLPANEIIRNHEKLALVETHSTYLENAVAKARVANQAAHFPALADDSGLEVESLGGKPGVKSHRYAIPKAGMDQDEANLEKLLDEMKGYSKENRKARFVASLALVMEGILIHSEGILNGTIAEKPRGSNGFGYDPVFIPEGSTLTLAEMSEDEKNKISHRAKATQNLLLQIQKKRILFARP